MACDLSSIPAYEFTLRAKRKLEFELDRLDPVDFDSERIFRYLLSLTPVPFHLYLERWLFRETGLSGEFEEIESGTYVDIIRRSFYEQGVPFSWEETAKKPAAIIKGWLSRNVMRRSTLFLLGFGLHMSDIEVSDFLMKGLREIDFDFSDPKEALYWHCFHTGKSFRMMRELEADAVDYQGTFRSKGFYETVYLAPMQYLADEEILIEYLAWLNANRGELESRAYEVWKELYLKLGKQFSETDERRIASAIENRFCSATPRTVHDNLNRFCDSQLAGCFSGYRITRQRLEHVRKKQTAVSRSDLITLYFYLFGNQVQEGGAGAESFAQGCSRLLESCHMRPLYEVNPYEAFLMLASRTAFPIDLYSEVIELSFAGKSSETGGAEWK